MKVKDFIKKFRLCSNADIFLQTPDGAFAQLRKEEIKNIKPETLMSATINSFDIIDNVITIYIKGK